MTDRLLAILRAPETITLALLVVALAIGAAMSPAFLDAAYLLDKTSFYMPIAFAALTMTLVIITGNIDLSVASGTVLVAVAAALAFEQWSLPMGVVIPLALALGTLLGLFNGLLITRLRLPSLVVTLGTLALFRGLAQVLIEERTVRGFPAWFVGIDYVKIGIVPLPLVLFLAAAAVLAVLLRRTTFGRSLFAIGTNESAARFAGIPTDRVKLLVFALSGLAMGIGALILMSQIRTIDHKQMRGWELVAITAVVLGGTSIFGGRGGMLGTVLAMLLLVVVRSAMGMSNIKAENQLAVIGTLLIVSVLLTNLSTQGRWARRRTRPTGGTVHA